MRRSATALSGQCAWLHILLVDARGAWLLPFLTVVSGSLYEHLGHPVVAANYFGDEGAHVAKCLW